MVSKVTGETIGTTPFEKDFPRGRDQLGFVFKKASYEDEESSFVPESARSISATLRPSRSRAQASASADDARKAGAAPVKTSSRSKTSRPKKTPGTTRPLDGDAVLEPSFNF